MNNSNSKRRNFFVATFVAFFYPKIIMSENAFISDFEIWKSPNCGCCVDWVNYMTKNGYKLKAVHNIGNSLVRERLGIPHEVGSCHTAVIGKYAIEGHVPVSDIKRLFKENKDVIGLSVPKMPIGTPGMDGPEYLGRKDPYNVFLILKNKSITIFTSYL